MAQFPRPALVRNSALHAKAWMFGSSQEKRVDAPRRRAARARDEDIARLDTSVTLRCPISRVVWGDPTPGQVQPGCTPRFDPGVHCYGLKAGTGTQSPTRWRRASASATIRAPSWALDWR